MVPQFYITCKSLSLWNVGGYGIENIDQHKENCD